MRENYIPVLTGDDRPLAPCHPRRARGLVANGKASFKHKSGIRCIVIHKTNIPKVKRASKLVLRIDPGSKTTGIASTRECSASTTFAGSVNYSCRFTPCF